MSIPDKIRAIFNRPPARPGHWTKAQGIDVTSAPNELVGFIIRAAGYLHAAGITHATQDELVPIGGDNTAPLVAAAVHLGAFTEDVPGLYRITADVAPTPHERTQP